MQETKENKWVVYLTRFIIIITTAMVFFSCGQQSNKEKDIKEEYSKVVEHFKILDEIAMEAVLGSDTMSKEVYLSKLKKTALADWVECVNLFDEAKKLDLPPDLEKNRMQFSKYSDHRIQQMLLFIKATEEETDKYNKSIDSIQSEINKLTEKLNKTAFDTDTSNLKPLKQL